MSMTKKLHYFCGVSSRLPPCRLLCCALCCPLILTVLLILTVGRHPVSVALAKHPRDVIMAAELVGCVVLHLLDDLPKGSAETFPALCSLRIAHRRELIAAVGEAVEDRVLVVVPRRLAVECRLVAQLLVADSPGCGALLGSEAPRHEHAKECRACPLSASGGT